MPERKKKCPSCGRYIYVKTRPSDRLRVLVTEEGAKQIEAERNLKSMTERYGISKKELEETSKRLSNKFGYPAKARDVMWAILSDRTIDSMKKGDWGKLGSLSLSKPYFCMRKVRSVFISYKNLNVVNYELISPPASSKR